MNVLPVTPLVEAELKHLPFKFNNWGNAKADFDTDCGVEFRHHDLRRTMATKMAQLGAGFRDEHGNEILEGDFVQGPLFPDSCAGQVFWNADKGKREETERVSWEAVGARLPHFTAYPVWLTYTWYSKDGRIDTDNVAFAVKFIHDGLVDAGVLDGDGRKHVAGFSHAGFFIDKVNPRVEITIAERVTERSSCDQDSCARIGMTRNLSP